MAPPKKRRRTDAPTEITFDPAAREEYLTGFHKRKVARKEHAKELAMKREKEDKARERRQLREKRKEELDEHIQAINAEMKKQNKILSGDFGTDHASDTEGGEEEEEAEFTGFDEQVQAQPTLPHDDEFVDEDKYTTVTVTAMGGSEDEEDRLADQEVTSRQPDELDQSGKLKKKRIWTKDRLSTNANAKPSVKKRKFRYESKAERAISRQKQKSRNSKAAKARRNA